MYVCECVVQYVSFKYKIWDYHQKRHIQNTQVWVLYRINDYQGRMNASAVLGKLFFFCDNVVELDVHVCFGDCILYSLANAMPTALMLFVLFSCSRAITSCLLS